MSAATVEGSTPPVNSNIGTPSVTAEHEHPIHPWYGPCDGFAPGNNCSVCVETFRGIAVLTNQLRKENDQLREALGTAKTTPKVGESLRSHGPSLFYVSRQVGIYGSQYLHKNGTWQFACGVENQWDTREDAQAALDAAIEKEANQQPTA